MDFELPLFYHTLFPNLLCHPEPNGVIDEISETDKTEDEEQTNTRKRKTREASESDSTEGADDDEKPLAKKGCGRRRIPIDFITDRVCCIPFSFLIFLSHNAMIALTLYLQNRRSVSFSKRKKGLLKKANELHVLTGSDIVVMMVSESGSVYSYAVSKSNFKYYRKLLDLNYLCSLQILNI